MSIRAIQNFDTVAEILAFLDASGIGVVDGIPFMRTTAGLMAIGPAQVGTAFFLDAANGDDANSGLSPSEAVQTLAAAYALATDGAGDVIYVISNGLSSGTVRIDAAFTWSKNNTHLVGISSGVNISNRSRLAPTGSTTAFANFFTVSGSGCLFQNLQWFHGFNTGTTAAICLTVSGGRNCFVNCHIAGMGDAASAQDAGSRNLKLATTGENQFLNCVIGIDTIARTAANASVEFSGGCPRNVFKKCTFLLWATSATVLGVIVSAAAGSDRFQLFEDCTFINSIKSGAGTAITGLATLAAAIGGLIALVNPRSIGVTAYGTDATSKGQMYLVGPANSTSAGIGANPA
jgi:hypothetical protein